MSDDRRSSATAGALGDSLRMTEEASQKYDECPKCGNEYVDLDTTLAGDLVFVHQESPLKTCTVDTGSDQNE